MDQGKNRRRSIENCRKGIRLNRSPSAVRPHLCALPSSLSLSATSGEFPTLLAFANPHTCLKRCYQPPGSRETFLSLIFIVFQPNTVNRSLRSPASSSSRVSVSRYSYSKKSFFETTCDKRRISTMNRCSLRERRTETPFFHIYIYIYI